MITLEGYESCESIVETRQFSLLRVRDSLHHENFIAKVYHSPSEKQVQSVKNIVDLVKEEDWNDVLQPVTYLLQKDAVAIIFKNAAGCTLRQFIIEHGKIMPSRFVPVAISLCRMLTSFHSNGWIIGNLRPEFILIDAENEVCRIADLEKTTRVFKKQTESSYTFTEIAELKYISPEQTGRTNQIIDYRSDYYSLGIIFYEMLAGKLPFSDSNASELLYAHIARQPERLKTVDPYLPLVLSDIVMKLLNKNPGDRYQTLSGLLYDLEESTRYFQDDFYLESFKIGQKDFVSHITISGTLMGRDKELAIINDAYQLSLIGIKQALYVEGYSGVGKSRLVEEFILKKVNAASFVSKAKFDTLQRNSPYSALIDAIRSLIRNLLRTDEIKLNFWKDRLLSFLHDNGQIIINVVPELEIVIGKQPPLDELSPDESQNRFQQTFLNFISAFCSGEYLLILFLDDLQWADLASVKLIELMIYDNNISNFLFLGSYRDNEVDPTHPLVISLQKQEKRADIKELKLYPLEKSTTGNFILETLKQNVENPDELIEKIFHKTQGNIFYTIQLITSLNDAGLLYKDGQGLWKWDKKALEEYNFAENVIELLVQKINNLDALQKKILQTGACVGDSFDLLTTAHVTGERLYTIANELSAIINMGYLFTRDENLDHYSRSSQNTTNEDLDRIGNVRFQFSHDRIRQACLSMVNEEELALINFKAGQFKLKHYTPSEIEEEIFLIANHLNMGSRFTREKEDIQNLVDINLRAGKKAMDATAYHSAIEYFNKGKEFLNFNDDYKVLYDFCLQRAACKYQTGQYDEAEHDLNELYQKSLSRIDKLEVLMLKVYMYTSNEEKEKAVESGKTGFHLYGLRMPGSKAVIMTIVLKDVIKAKWILRGKRMDLLPQRKVMKDAEQRRFLEFALAVSPPIYQYDQNLFAWDVMKMVSYSLRYGNNGVASFGYIGYGMILAQTFADYQAGKKLADISILINKQLGYGVLKWKLGIVYNNFVQHWTMPVRPEFDNMQDLINGCISNGDPIYAGYGIFHYHQKKFLLGFPLGEIQQSIEDYMKGVDLRGDKETRHFLEGYYHAVRCLRGVDENILLLGQSFGAPERLAQIVASSSFSVAADTYIAYMNILYQFQYYGEAWQRYLEGSRYVEFIYHRYEFAEFNFYGGLICVMACEKKLSPVKPYLKRLKGHLQKLKMWSANCAENFEPLYLLLEAEASRINVNAGNTATLYEKAIQSADKYLFINIKALANELAGRFHFSSGNVIIAKTYLDNARNAYKQWGALLKVKYLEKEFESVFGNSILEATTKTASQEVWQNADMDVVLQASNTINNTRDFDRMIEKLMQTVIQNSGADTGYILIRNRADLLIKASFNLHEGPRSVSEYPDVNMLPLNVIRYAGRVKELLLINNPARQAEYSDLPYFLAHQPLSVLIYPVLKQGELFGLLYLENYVTEGIFDSRRIGMLKLISSQILMLLDNANLNMNMESRIRERTFELETEKNRISGLLENIFPKEAIAELKATGKVTPQELQNVTVMIADIKGFTNISERLNPGELIAMIDNYFRAFDEIMGKYGLEKIKTIGDAYMAIGGIGKTLYNGAEKMVQAALEMQEFSKQLLKESDKEQVELRIGIHTGVVIAGVVGSKKLQYDIWGDTVNIAARMEQNSEASRVNISEVTRNLVKDKFQLIYRGKIEAKNKGEMDMYFVEPL
ncbi:MAG: adenylate/guanylate cyclase domain-containing protein [Ginsengibacter sp.]